MMDKFPITIVKENEIYHFDVVDHVHHTGDRCQFEVYQHGRLVASFEPDAHEHLQVCKNNENLDETLLHLVADEIETHDW